MSKRPRNKEEMENAEAIGVIRASRFITKYARSHKPITVETICAIHKKIFEDAWSEIAGKYRYENVIIADSKLLPPHYSAVPAAMTKVDEAITHYLTLLSGTEGILLLKVSESERERMVIHIMTFAAWLHHQITFIHPFREGNGRTARLAANLILERFGLRSLSVKIERENKNQYRDALQQADALGDLDPLINLMIESLNDRYAGVNLKYYSSSKNPRKKLS